MTETLASLDSKSENQINRFDGLTPCQLLDAECESILQLAMAVIERKKIRDDILDSTTSARTYFSLKLGNLEIEKFAVVFVDSQHRVCHYEELFQGTIGSCSVYPREVLRRVIEVNASAVIFAHNHPSGNTEPSSSDIHITEQLGKALKLIDVRVLDHLIIGGTDILSFAERGLL